MISPKDPPTSIPMTLDTNVYPQEDSGNSSVSIPKIEAGDQPKDEPKKGHFIHPDRLHLFDNRSQVQKISTDSDNKTKEQDRANSSRAPDGGPPDGDDGDSSGEDNYSGRRRQNNRRGEGGLRPENSERSKPDSDQNGWQRGLGISGLMKAFVGKPTFSGSWEEDLDNCINVFNTLSSMSEISSEEKLKAVPVMLGGDALSFFANNSSTCESFQGAMELLRNWYNSDDRKARVLTKWQGMKLSEALSQKPEESEVAVFRTFVAELMSMQNQLDKSYHQDQFLRDRLLTAVDIPSIQNCQ